MKTFFILLVLTWISCNAIVYAQSPDTVGNNPASGDLTYDYDHNIGLGLFALLMFCMAIFCVGAGAIAAILLSLLLFVFVSWGILSTSVIVGINKKSFTKGFRIFLVLSGGISGAALCAGLFFLLNKILHWSTSLYAFGTGAAFGLVVGVILGYITSLIVRKLTNFFKSKLRLS